MENPPELKGDKQKHNVRTLKKMAEMMVSEAMIVFGLVDRSLEFS